MEKFMDQTIGGGESQITPEILERIKMEGCPECGLKGGTHTPECYYFGAISSEMAAVKQPVISEAPKVEIAEASVEKKEEKEMTPADEEKFRKELLEKAKVHEEFVEAVEPTAEIPKPLEISKPKELKKEGGVFEELFVETPAVEKSLSPIVGTKAEVLAEPKKEVIEEKPKEVISPAVEMKATVPEVKEVKKEFKKEEIAANAVITAVEMARDFISAGSTKITEEQAEKAALAALKDWEKITAGMTVDERFKTFGAAEQAILDKIPEGKILEKLKEKIYIVIKEER